MRIILSFNPESYGEKIRLYNLIFRKIGYLNIPFIQFTLNLQDISNIFIIKLAGEDIILYNISIRSLLLKLTLKNLSLVVQCFYTIITVFFNCFFKTLLKEIGVFSTVSSYFRVVESITQIIIYLHRFTQILKNFNTANLTQRLVTNLKFKKQLITYIQSIVRETVNFTLS